MKIERAWCGKLSAFGMEKVMEPSANRLWPCVSAYCEPSCESEGGLPGKGSQPDWQWEE